MIYLAMFHAMRAVIAFRTNCKVESIKIMVKFGQSSWMNYSEILRDS